MSNFVTKIKSYLDLSETQISGGYEYDVDSGPFQTYTTEEHNCFAATAVFASWLGYDKLMEIYNEASSYHDYTAYKLYQEYGENWDDHGYYNC